MISRTSRRWALWIGGAAVIVVALVLGGTFVYIHFISGPAPAQLSLKAPASQAGSPAASGSPTATGGTAAATPLAGRWRVASGSVVGYRVKEVLFGQDNVAVGRTGDLAGQLTISGTTVTGGSFTVQMASIKSDQSQRDAQFRGRIMDTAAYPTGTLVLARPITLPPLPATGVIRTYTAAANLTLHGHTRQVSFPLSAERAGAGIEISGSIPVLFADWDIPNPSFGSLITTQDHGVLEFLIKFNRA
jgi:polyisoprenoid-binding protein YceI